MLVSWTILLIYQYQIFKKYKKKEWTEAQKKKKLYKCIIANTSIIWQHAAHTTDHSHLLTAEQEPYKKAYLLTKNIEEFSGKTLEERASRQKKIRQKG